MYIPISAWFLAFVVTLLVEAPIVVILLRRVDLLRLAIVVTLRHRVCEMAAATGERENNVSNHLAKLRAAGLVKASRHDADARWVYYERDPEACARALAGLAELLS